MIIKQELPFAYCEQCENFILKAHDTIVCNGNTSQRVITAKCKNEWMCKQIAAETGKELQSDGGR